MSAALVLDADQPSAIAIIRSLARRGLEVHVASAESNPLGAYSRHAGSRFRYPDPLTDETGFISWLEDQTRSQVYALVVPVTERSVVPLMRHRDRFDPRVLAVAPSEGLQTALDKDRTLNLAASLGLKVPRSRLVNALAELDNAVSGFEFPIVVKPASSFGSDAVRRVQRSVGYAFDTSDVARQVATELPYGPVILQEYFRGEGVGIELIAERGELRYVFQHRRLHEVPLTGGGSSLRIAESPIPVLRDAAAALMRAMSWHGVAMVEFKFRPETNDYRLMEINGRFWGSLPLAVAAGADFPAMLYELMTTGTVGQHPPARAGTVCRSLSRDVEWLEHVFRRAAPPGLVSLPSAGQVLRDTLLALSPRHHFDLQSWSDPRPGLVELQRLVLRYWHRIHSRLAHRRRLWRERRRAHRQGVARLAEARNVLFLCYGNINRSALAQLLAAKSQPDRYEFSSAGLHPVQGREADRTMIQVAKPLGVDLSGWRSRTVTAEMVENADLILAMECAHLEHLEHAFPGAASKAYLLGALVADSSLIEVPDPYGQTEDVYARVSRHVATALDAWFRPV